MEAGDEREAARLEHREPGVHIGPHNVARAERGVYLERTKGILHSRVGNSQEDPETSIPSEALWIDGLTRTEGVASQAAFVTPGILLAS